MAATIHIHHRHLLLLLSPKADTHFTVPRRVEARLSRRTETWSWFQRLGEACRKDRSVISHENDVGGRDKVTEQRRGYGDMQIGW